MAERQAPSLSFAFSALTSCFLSSFLSLTTGCSSAHRKVVDARQAFAWGQFAEAAEAMEVFAQKPRFRDPAELDLAMIEFAAGDFAAAEERLRGCRDRFESVPKISLAQDTISLAADDNVRVYRPAGYEEVMVRTMLSLCSLAGDGVDAESYALQAMTKQNMLHRESIEEGILADSVPYQPLALAPYVRGILREATHHDYDDASRAYRLVSSINPSFLPATEDLARASHGVHSQPGHGVLYVLGCVGHGPLLMETDEPTTTAAMQIASTIVNAQINQTDDPSSGPALPNLASVKVPHVAIPPSAIAAIGVEIDGQLHGATQTIADIGLLALTQNEAEMPWKIARAIARRAFKEAAVARATHSMGIEGHAGSLLHFATVSAWSATETADTRCWSLLPREFQVLRAELPIGAHEVTLQPLGPNGGSVEQATRTNVTITEGRNCYIFAIAPEARVHVAGSQLISSEQSVESLTISKNSP